MPSNWCEPQKNVGRLQPEVADPFCYHELRLNKVAANNMVHLSPTTVSDVQTLAAYAIFLASYLVFALGKFPGLKIDRAGAAIIGAVAWWRSGLCRQPTRCGSSISPRWCCCSR
jgi:hypothetical protein